MTLLSIPLLLSILTSFQPAVKSDSVKVKQIKEITVYGLELKNISLPIVSVDHKKIEKADYITPADALKDEPGLYLSQDGIWPTSVNIRGMSEQRTITLMNGDLLQSATDIAGPLSTVNMDNIKRIDVIKGAASVIYGSGAMGGVVNIIPYAPTYTDSLKRSGHVSSGYHTVNHLWTNAANVTFSDSTWYFSVNGSYRAAQNTMTPMGELNNSQFNDASFGITGGLKYVENQELKVNYQHFEAWNVGIPGSNVFPSSATVKYTNIKRTLMDAEYIFSNISRNFKTLSFKAYTQNISRNVSNTVNSNALIQPSSLNTTSGLKAIGDFYFNAYNTITAGVETWYRDARTARMKYNYGSDTTLVVDQPTPQANMLDIGAFAHYQSVIDPHHLTLNYGLRGDLIETRNDTAFNMLYEYLVNNGTRKSLPFTQTVNFKAGSALQPAYAAHIDINYSPVKQHKFSFSLATSYRVPSIEERFKYINLGSAIYIGNPDLKPEMGYFSNLSYSFISSKLFFKTNLFVNYLNNLITEEKKALVSIYVNENIDQALYTGGELQLSWLISNKLSLKANASYVRARNIKNHTYLPLIPPAHGIVEFDYRYRKLCNAGLAAEWAATQNEVASTETATPGHLIFNFNVQSLPILLDEGALNVYAGVNNILNTAYKNHLFNNRGFDYYQPGRNVFIKVKYGW